MLKLLEPAFLALSYNMAADMPPAQILANAITCTYYSDFQFFKLDSLTGNSGAGNP